MTRRDLHLGYRPEELASSPYARFWRPDLAPLSEAAGEALRVGPVAHELMAPVAAAGGLLSTGYEAVETGYSLAPGGEARLAILTPMPGVAPAMWAWWFAWHGSEAQRYKLWHPRAHVDAAWADGRHDLETYVGRTSRVVEYIGSSRLALTIRFVPPASLGLDEARLAAAGEVAICARGGIAGTPVETGWLIHHVRPTADGAEMRSRFWLGGDNVRPRGASGDRGRWLGRALARLAPVSAAQAADLLVHCAQEMAHLAATLPALHAEFGLQEPAR